MAIRALAFPRQRHVELMPVGPVKRGKMCDANCCDANCCDAMSCDAMSCDAMSIGMPPR
jgi:hypothetical protein